MNRARLMLEASRMPAHMKAVTREGPFLRRVTRTRGILSAQIRGDLVDVAFDPREIRIGTVDNLLFNAAGDQGLSSERVSGPKRSARAYQLTATYRVEAGGKAINEDLTLHDARTLSSGTIATLTGLNKYSDLDKVQGAFVDFVEESGPGKFPNWQAAWRAFEVELKRGKAGRALSRELSQPMRLKASRLLLSDSARISPLKYEITPEIEGWMQDAVDDLDGICRTFAALVRELTHLQSAAPISARRIGHYEGLAEAVQKAAEAIRLLRREQRHMGEDLQTYGK